MVAALFDGRISGTTRSFQLKLLYKGQLTYELLLLKRRIQAINLGVIEDQVNEGKRLVLPTGSYIPSSLFIKGIVLIKGGELYPRIYRKSGTHRG